VTQLSLAFLQKEGLEALHRLAAGELPYDSFRETALAEQVVRIDAAKAARAAKQDEERERMAALQEKSKRAFEQAEAARQLRESDPRYIAKKGQRDLRARYGIDAYVEQECFRPLMEILKRIDAGQRLSAEDFCLAVLGRRRLLHRRVASRLSPTGSRLLCRRVQEDT
jgi:hypothetical protein